MKFCDSILTEHPKIESIRRVVVQENENVELECSCSGCLPLKSHAGWVLVNKKRKKVTNNFIDEDNNTYKTVLKIEKVNSNDEGYYECEIRNLLGSSRKRIELRIETSPKELSLTVNSKRVASNQTVTIQENENLRMNCNAKAYPVPEVTWFKDNVVLSSDPIINITSENFGADSRNHEGTYRCEIRNKLGFLSRSILLKVQIPSTSLGSPAGNETLL